MGDPFEQLTRLADASLKAKGDQKQHQRVEPPLAAGKAEGKHDPRMGGLARSVNGDLAALFRYTPPRLYRKDAS